MIKFDLRLLRDSALYVGERLLTAMVNLAVLFALTRHYSVETFGAWSYALAVVQFASPFLAVGAEPIVVRDLVAAKDDAPRILGSSALVLAATTLVSNIIVLAYLLAENGDDFDIMAIGALAAIASFPSVMLVLEHYFRSEARSKPIVIARLAASLTGGLLKVTLALSGFSIVTVAGVLPVEAAIMAGVLSYAARDTARWQFDLSLSLRILRQCLPAMGSALAVTLFLRINYILLARLTDLHEVAIYALAASIVHTVMFVPGLPLSAFYPKLVAMAATDPEHFRRTMRRLFFWSSLFCYCGVAGAVVAGPFLFPFLFGEKYAGGVPVLSWMFAAMVAMVSGLVRAVAINIRMRQVYHFWSSLAGLAALVPVSLVLIPLFGAAGAAAAVLVGCFVSSIGTTWFLPQVRPLLKDQIAGLLLIYKR